MRLKNVLPAVNNLYLFVVMPCVLLLIVACTPAGLPAPATPIALQPTLSSTLSGAEAVTPANTPMPTATPDMTPRVTANANAVNLRLGPGINYDPVGILLAGQSLEIVGRNADTSWWQVTTPDGLRWIAASVTVAVNIDSDIPVISPPPPPTSAPPTNTPIPPPPTPTPAPQYQYTIRNVFGQVNEAITQIRGDIRDGNGNPVNGIRVRVRSGSFCTVSYPSGPAGGYPPGGYDVLLDNRAKDGSWQVAIVNGPVNSQDTKCNAGLAVLSEEVTVPTNTLEGVTFVEWRKNY